MNFNHLAARYDAWYQTPLGSVARALELDAILSLAGVKPGERAMDIGCGTGIYALELAQRGAHVIGIDPSMEMIAIAREKLRQAGLTGRFVCGSAEALPFRSGTVDLALGVTSLCYMHSPDRAIEEMRRVLRPGGRLVLGELNRFSFWAFLRRLKGLFRQTIYNQAHFWSRRELERLLQKSGFHPSAARTLLYFPPIPSRTFLKRYRFFDVVLKKLLPGTGAFIAMRAERR
jgi:ubiquinone/menaquinone biosynthesis C-methylase UbiE